MKAIINKDKVTLAETEVDNSGSINYYKLYTEFDESWADLTKEAILTQGSEGVRIPVSGNYVMIDRAISGTYAIGFIGYTLEYHLTTDTAVDPNKTYYTLEDDIYVIVANPVAEELPTYYEATKDFQISTNLVSIYFIVGAGEINVMTSHDLPDATTWEAYVRQIQDLIRGIEYVDIDATKVGDTATINITNRDNVTKTVEVKDGKSVTNIQVIDGNLVVTIE